MEEMVRTGLAEPVAAEELLLAEGVELLDRLENGDAVISVSAMRP